MNNIKFSNREEVSIDVASTLDGLAGIDDFDTRCIVFVVGPVGGKTRSCSRDRTERTCLAASLV